MFLVDAIVSSFVPYREQLVLRAFGIDDDLIDKTAHIARTASTRTIDVVAHIVGVPDAPVVVESEVEVPDGACVDGVVQAMLVHEDAPIGVDVAREFAHEEMSQEGVEVEVTAPVALHLVEVIADVVLLGRGDAVGVGRLDGDGFPLIGVEIGCFAIGIGIDFEEVTACERIAAIVARCHLLDLDTILVNLDVVAKLVTALVFAVEQRIDGTAVGCVGHTQQSAQLEGEEVTHQRLVAVVVDECPLPGVGRCIEHVLLAFELDAPGLLGEIA